FLHRLLDGIALSGHGLAALLDFRNDTSHLVLGGRKLAVARFLLLALRLNFRNRRIELMLAGFNGLARLRQESLLVLKLLLPAGEVLVTLGQPAFKFARLLPY